MTGRRPRPLVSVICPTHNRSAAIGPTLTSVLAQDVADIELIVVLDGCTDDTGEVVSDAAGQDDRIRVIAVDRCGHPSRPRNIALAAAGAPMIAYIDHDDEWSPEHLALLLDAIGDEAAVAAATTLRFADGSTAPRQPDVAMVWHPELQLVAPLFRPSAVLHRAGVAERAGSWLEGPGLEDWDLWVRMTDVGVTFATTAVHTVTARVATSTRIHRVRRPHAMVVATCDSGADARAVADELTELSRSERFADARRRDAIAWYDRLADEPRFRSPVAWRRSELLDHVAAAVTTDESTYLDEIAVVAAGEAFRVQCPLWCSTVSHADRIVAAHPTTAPRQVSLVADVVDRVAGRHSVTMWALTDVAASSVQPFLVA